MKILLYYLSRYKWFVVLTFVLAIINQCFSLLDPYILGKIIDGYATKPKDHTAHSYLTGTLFLVGCAIGVAMVSRIAKAFQDYFMNVVIQRFGAAIYTDGLKHSLQLPFQEFEDQRSGETLNILQKVRLDSEKFMQNFINVFFFAIVGIIFVMIYAITTYPITGQTNVLAGATTESLRNIELIKSLGLTDQEIVRLNDATQKILVLELTKVKQIRSIAFAQGTLVNFLRQSILFSLLYLIFQIQFFLFY